MSRKLSKKQQELVWRRNKVMDLSSKGMTQDQIATELQVSQGTVSEDLTNLKAEAQKHLEKHVTETLPHEYQKCMVGINQVLNMAWSIVNKSLDDKTKLQALALINDCNKYKMDLTTNGSLVMDSVKIVQNRLNQLNGVKKSKLQQDIKQKEGKETEQSGEQEQEQEQKTHNGIF